MFLAKAFQTDPRPRQEANALTEAGYAVHVLAWDQRQEHSAFETVDGASVRSFHYLHMGRFSKISIGLGAILLQFILVFEAVKQISQLKQRPIVHAHDFNTFLPACLLRLLRLCPRLVYDCHELTPAAYSELFNPVLGGIAQTLESAFLPYADAVITVSDPIADYLRPFNRATHVIFNCVRREDIPTLTRSEARTKLGLDQDVFIISSVGSLRYDSRVDLLLAVASASRNENLRVLIVGGGPLASDVRRTVLDSKDSRLTVLPQVPREKALLYVSASDLTWVVYPAFSMNSSVGMPWKFFESLACGVPVIVERGTFRAELVKKFGCGLVLETDAPDEISRCIGTLSHQTQRLQKMRIAARETATKEFDWKAMSQRLIGIYEQL